MGGETDAGEETYFTETDGSVYEQKPTTPTVFNRNQVFLRPLLLYLLMHCNMPNTQNTHMSQHIMKS